MEYISKCVINKDIKKMASEVLADEPAWFTQFAQLTSIASNIHDLRIKVNDIAKTAEFAVDIAQDAKRQADQMGITVL